MPQKRDCALHVPVPRKALPGARASVRVAVGLCLASALSCSSPSTGVPGDAALPPADVRVLFLGNSLTFTNNMPEMVQTIAEAAGHTLAWRMVAGPNISLEEHWFQGSQDAVRAAEADVVVLQQGPSSLPANQEHLRFWSEAFAPIIREAGGIPALYMVWPEASRQEAFDAVRDSYANAAIAVDGLFVPAGEAWRHAWSVNPDLELYGPDGFHPSVLGSQVVALTIFRVLFDESVSGLPARMEPTSSGLPVVDLGADASVVLPAVESAVAAAAAGPPGPPTPVR